MQVTEKKLENAVIELEINIPADRVNDEYKTVFERVRTSAKVDGFRKGMAPMQIIESRFQKTADQDVAGNLAKQYFVDAITEKGLQPISEPVYDYEAIRRGEPFTFKALFEIFPTVELGKYRQVPATERSCAIEDRDVDKEIESLRENYARVEKKEGDVAVANGDLINLKLKRLDEASDPAAVPFKEYSIIVGKSKDEYTIDKQVLGMKRGDEREVKITYPGNYHTPDLAGKSVTYLVHITDIQLLILPDLDDEFAKKMNYESMKDMTARMRENLAKYVEDKIRNEVKTEIVKNIVENSKFDIPESMVRSEMNHIYQKTCQRIGFSGSLEKFEEKFGIKADDLREKIRKEAEQSIKSTIVLSEIAKKEDVQVSEDMIRGAIAKIAEKSNTTVEKIEEVIAQNDSRGSIETDLKFEATLDFLYNNAKIKKSKGISFDELINEKVT